MIYVYKVSAESRLYPNKKIRKKSFVTYTKIKSGNRDANRDQIQ